LRHGTTLAVRKIWGGGIISKKDIYRNILFFLSAVTCAVILFPFLSTLGLAAIFAFVLYPYLEKVLKMNWKGHRVESARKGTLLILISVFLFFSVPLTIIAVKFYAFIIEFNPDETGRQQLITKFSEHSEKIKTSLAPLFFRMGVNSRSLDELLNDLAHKAANKILDFSATFITGAPGFLLGVFIFFAALYSFLVEAPKIKKIFNESGLFTRREVLYFADALRKSCSAAVISSILTGLAQATILASGARLTQTGDFPFIFSLTFFCSFLPIIGTAPVALGLALSASLSGLYNEALVVLAIAMFGGILENFMRALLIEHASRRVHPLVSLLSILGGMVTFGAPGLFIGPVLVEITYLIFTHLLYPSSLEVPSQKQDSINLNASHLPWPHPSL